MEEREERGEKDLKELKKEIGRKTEILK